MYGYVCGSNLLLIIGVLYLTDSCAGVENSSNVVPIEPDLIHS